MGKIVFLHIRCFRYSALILLDVPGLACFALNISGSLFVVEFMGERVRLSYGPGEPDQIVVYSGNSTVVDVGKKWKVKTQSIFLFVLYGFDKLKTFSCFVYVF